MTKEPVAITGALTQLVTAIIAALVGFDVVSWTQEQIGLVLGVWAAITAVVLVLWTRSKVTPVQ